MPESQSDWQLRDSVAAQRGQRMPSAQLQIQAGKCLINGAKGTWRPDISSRKVPQMFSDPKSRSVRYVWLLNLIPFAGLGLVYGGGPKVLPYLLFLWFLEILSPAFRGMMVPLYFLLSIVGSVMLLAKQGKFNSMNSQDLSLYQIRQMRGQQDERHDEESGLGAAVAKERQLRIQKLRELVETWQQRATMAVQQGNDALAKEALRRKDQYLKELAVLRKDDNAKNEQRETDDEKSNFAFDTFEHKVQAAQKQMSARQAEEAKQASQHAAALRAGELNLDEELQSASAKASKQTSPLGSVASPDAGASIILNTANRDALAIRTKLGADVVASSKLNSLDFSPKPLPRPVEPAPVHTTGADALAGSFDSFSAGGAVGTAFDASGTVADRFADTTSSSSAQDVGSSAADPFDTKGTVDPFADTNKSSDPFADSNSADSTVNASTDSASASDHGASVANSFSASRGTKPAFDADLDSSSTFSDANAAADPFASVNSASDSVMADIAKADPFACATAASSTADGFSSTADPFAATSGANDDFAAEAGLSDPFADESKPQVVRDGATVPPIVSALVAQSIRAGASVTAASNAVAKNAAASSSTAPKTGSSSEGIGSANQSVSPAKSADASSSDYVSSPYLSSVFGEDSNSSSAASFASASALRNDPTGAASNALAGASGASFSTNANAAPGTGSASQSSSTVNPNDYVSSAYVSSVFGEDSNSSSAASFASASALRNEPTSAASNTVAGASGASFSTNANAAPGTGSASQSSSTVNPNDYVSSAYVSSVFGEDSNSSSAASFASASALRNEPTTSPTPPESDHPYGSNFDSSYSTPTFDLPTFKFTFDSAFGGTSSAGGSDPASASAAKTDDLVCPKCGASRDKNFSFCISCGQNY